MDKFTNAFKMNGQAELDKKFLAAELAKYAEDTRKQALRVKMILKGIAKATDTAAKWAKVFTRVQAVKAETKEFGESLEWYYVHNRKKVKLCTMPAGPKLDRLAAVDVNGEPIPETFEYRIMWPMF